MFVLNAYPTAPDRTRLVLATPAGGVQYCDVPRQADPVTLIGKVVEL